MVETLARAVQAAHEGGVIHRDSSRPTSCSPPTRAEDADFGLAKRLDVEASQTHEGDILGIPAHGARTGAAGDAVGPLPTCTLGAILYEMRPAALPSRAKPYGTRWSNS